MRKLLIDAFGPAADDPWIIKAENVEKIDEYYGISVSNGVLGAVSSRFPFQLSSTVLAGVYDKIGRGRVDNLVQTFPALNLEFYFNGKNILNTVCSCLITFTFMAILPHSRRKLALRRCRSMTGTSRATASVPTRPPLPARSASRIRLRNAAKRCLTILKPSQPK